MIKLGQWHRDNMGDYVIEIESKPKMVRGRIIRCPIVHRYRQRFWKTKPRWLLLVNDYQYGFWNKLSEAIARFEKDCVPSTPKKPTVDDPYGEYYCWHGDKPHGPGPYCTGCGGLIKQKTSK